MGIGVIKMIVDKIVSETPLLCMPEDRQMQRDYLEEKWLKWFKENMPLTFVSQQRELLIKELKDVDLKYIEDHEDQEWLVDRLIELINCG